MATKHGGIRTSVAVLVAALLSSLLGVVPQASATASGFHVSQGRLLDAHGNDFIMRGVNHPYSWFESEVAALGDIKNTGANTARIVLSTGARYARSGPDDIAMVVSACRVAKLICVLEVHDTTGFPEATGSISLDLAVDFWIESLDTLRGHEAYVIVNIGNEPFGNEQYGDWAQSTQRAVHRMRDAGFEHTLMVDAPNWGQDWSFTMRDNAQAVFDSDSQRNLVFDIHMYGVFDDGRKVREYLEHFVRAGLPLVIGEFGATHTDGDPDEVSIMHWAEMYGIGYLAWSWSGNVFPVEALNVVRDFLPTSRTDWGRQLIESPRGITSTADEATIFGPPVTTNPPLVAEPPVPVPLAGPTPLPVLLDHAEAESATRNGLQVAVGGAGYSGDGYLTGFDARGDSVTMALHVERAGQYQLKFGYRAPYGDKTQYVSVNANSLPDMVFPASTVFSTVSLAGVELVEGDNLVTVTHQWGWFDLDFVQVWTD